MTTKELVNRVLRWSELLKSNKYPPLGNEVAEGPKSKFTNFSLQHIMEKYNFLPSLMVKREFLLSMAAKNPELVKDAFFGDKFKYYVETDLPPPEEVPVAKEEAKPH
ncbi:conserved hypothetical protein [Theileria orientalis strain Shintoku]|uniref:Uncharacterized protein n=1 Tax=Theileria orientalis strain Shintoku TaxID=869250 RepID=J4DQ22_THEOR|nr:conserved hypothetical protein [Theileria orientalis strain Shintoku]PVC53616.1 hypothetical protein MACL_00003615 [Theileria orientalis]BAM41699.1 conserved hypothetical protein [Theileria orientalis strain Shintoku]|eukprot:XP_009692000.1 conserved hypothetical protein [Theileria orientalis strain Shintoku]